jgi:heme/copper-type cytochrome/quinol oxidase subunit 4
MIEYYILVAQIIPALILGITIQSVVHNKKSTYSKEKEGGLLFHFHLISLGFVLVYLVAGEIKALYSVYTESFSVNALIDTAAPMAFATIYILMQTFLMHFEDEKKIGYYIDFVIMGSLLVMLFVFPSLL